jgi:cytochrome c oxidase subunit IV
MPDLGQYTALVCGASFDPIRECLVIFSEAFCLGIGVVVVDYLGLHILLKRKPILGLDYSDKFGIAIALKPLGWGFVSGIVAVLAFKIGIIQNNFVSLMMAAASWSVLFNSVLQTTGKAEPRQTRGRKP